jgi:hypothetical protein
MKTTSQETGGLCLHSLQFLSYFAASFGGIQRTAMSNSPAEC